MCGVAGFLDPSGDTVEEMKADAVRMTGTLGHRGPDDEGVWVDANAGIALGHRRLAILDLSAHGHQPMSSEGGRYVVSFNGEIYNFRALRRELEGLRHRFRGHSDTEVMLAAIREWGLMPALERFNGMFAFALWDSDERTLYLARDRMGEKPMYYGWMGNAFLFGSELKALRAHPAFRGEVDRDALALSLRHNCIPAPWSIYRGIAKLLPGSVATLRASSAPGTAPTSSVYWAASDAIKRGDETPFRGSDDDATDALDELLRNSVRLRMESDVPLGAFLSGGVDSSAVVALMQAQSTRPVRTFTIGSPDTGFDEAEHARRVAAHIGTDHTELYVTAKDALGVIPMLPTLYDEPFADSSQIPTYLVASLARRHVTVSLSGDGGDELFGGYNRHRFAARIAEGAARWPRPIRKSAARALTSLSPQTLDAGFRRLSSVLPTKFRVRLPADKMQKTASILRSDGEDGAYLALVSHWNDPASVVLGASEPTTRVTNTDEHPKGKGFAERMMYLDLVTYLPDDILTKVDRATMAVGLEGRIPLLDHRIVELAWSLPMPMKIREGRGKWLLRKVLDRYVPRDLIERPKIGFGVPIGAWLRGPLRGWAESLLDERRLSEEGIFDPAPLRARWNEHISGRRDWEYALWDVLVFQAWLEHTAAPAGAVA